MPNAGALKDPVPPLTMLHEPVPVTGVLPPNEPLSKTPHRFCVDPTVAVLGDW